MNQISWYYTFPYGRKYEIGLYHSNDGHVVIYCDGAIMNIAFHIFDDTNFNFYIENKLLQVQVKKDVTGDFSYLLEDVTPKPEITISNNGNETRWHVWGSLIILMGFVGLFLFVFSNSRP